MTTSVAALLQPIKDRLNAATPGPWDRFDAQIRHTQIDGWIDPEGRKAAQEQTERDIQFVMNAPTDQAKLIAALEAVIEVHKTIHVAGPDGHGSKEWCPSCLEYSPCQTMDALTSALESAA